MKEFFKYHIWVQLIALLFLFSCSEEAKKSTPTEGQPLGKLELKFSFTGNGSPLVLGERYYRTVMGDSIMADDFKIYFSNLKLRRKDSTYYAIPKSYYLLNAAEPNGKTITIDSIPQGEYVGIEYGIGVDSVANHSITWVGRGDLSTTNGMSWDWNTGYKFILYEGAYRRRNASKVLTFHIGTSRNYKTNRISFERVQKANLKINPSKMGRLEMGVELTGVLNGPNFLNLEESNVVMFDANTTRMLAENTAQSCFTVKTVE